MTPQRHLLLQTHHYPSLQQPLHFRQPRKSPNHLQSLLSPPTIINVGNLDQYLLESLSVGGGWEKTEILIDFLELADYLLFPQSPVLGVVEETVLAVELGLLFGHEGLAGVAVELFGWG